MSGIGEALIVPAYSQHYAQRASAATVVAGPPLALDNITVPALYGGSIYRKLRAAYGGSPIRVRRSSDDAELDIPFVGGVLDTAALLAFVGAASGYVTAMYDQGLAGRHLTQTNTAKQPLLVNAGALITRGASKPAMDFSTGRCLQRADACGLTGAPAITTGWTLEFKNTAGYPNMWMLGRFETAITADGQVYASIGNGANSATAYISIMRNNGPNWNMSNTVGNWAHYTARIAAGARIDSSSAHQNGGVCVLQSVANNGAAVLTLVDELTMYGGGTGPSSADFRDIQGYGSAFMLFNAVLADGADLAVLETELAAHK